MIRVNLRQLRLNYLQPSKKGMRPLTIQQAAAKLGINRWRLTDLELNHSYLIEFSLMSRICELYHVTPGDIFTYIPDEESVGEETGKGDEVVQRSKSEEDSGRPATLRLAA